MDIDEYAAYVVNDEWYAVRKIQYLVYQLEETPGAGRQHLQMFVYFKKNVSLKTCRRRLGLPGSHCEALRGTPEQAAVYCKKEDTRVDGPYEFGDIPQQGRRTDLEELHAAIMAGDKDELQLIQEFFGPMVRAGSTYRRWMTLKKAADALVRYAPDPITLLLWQRKLLASLKSEAPRRRRIFWVWSTTSKTGKSTFMQYLRENCNACVGLWDLNNFLFIYQQSLAGIILFNLPRHQALDEKKLATLEALSDQGRIACGKYEGTEVMVAAHIVVFANIPPPDADLPDRIIEIHLDEHAILIRRNAFIGTPDLVCLEDPLPPSASMDFSQEDSLVITVGCTPECIGSCPDCNPGL